MTDQQQDARALRDILSFLQSVVPKYRDDLAVQKRVGRALSEAPSDPRQFIWLEV